MERGLSRTERWSPKSLSLSSSVGRVRTKSNEGEAEWVRWHLDPFRTAAFCGNAELMPSLFLIFVLDFCPSFLKRG